MKTFFFLFSLTLVLSACGSTPEVTVQDSGEVAELESMMDAPSEDAMATVDGYPYENTDYGFSLNFPESMKNFVVTPRREQVSYGEYESLASYDIGFEGYVLSGPEQNLQSFMNISVYKEADWDAIVAQGGLIQEKEVGRKGDYVFTMSHGQDVFPDGIKGSDYEILEKSFRVL